MLEMYHVTVNLRARWRRRDNGIDTLADYWLMFTAWIFPHSHWCSGSVSRMGSELEVTGADKDQMWKSGGGKRQAFERLLKFVDRLNFTCIRSLRSRFRWSGWILRANQQQNNDPTECLPNANQCFLALFYITGASDDLETTHHTHIHTLWY